MVNDGSVFIRHLYNLNALISFFAVESCQRAALPPPPPQIGSCAFHRQTQLLAVTQLSGGGQGVGAP